MVVKRTGWDGKEYEIDMELVQSVQEFNGESANMYESRWEYVESGAFERDYFAVWYENYDCANSCMPLIEDIIAQAQFIQKMIDNWFLAEEFGLINAEDGWRGIRYE